MHLYFYVRGVPSQVKLFEAHLQSQYWIWRRINLETNKEEETLVQGALRQSVLGAYEYVFPEECLADVLAVLGITTTSHIGAVNTAKNFLNLSILRKVFGCKKIPPKALKKAAKITPTMSIDGTMRGLSNIIIPGAALHVIGIKKDRREKAPQFGFEQEML